jgi:hypothetical protein
MWVASGNGSLVRIQAPWGDPEEVTLPPEIRINIRQLVFDGSYMWAKGRAQIIKINVVSLEVTPVTQQFPAASQWYGDMVFDGRHMWIPAQLDDNTVIAHKGDVDTNENLGSIQLPQTAICAAFDGTHLWFSGVGIVSKILVG